MRWFFGTIALVVMLALCDARVVATGLTFVALLVWVYGRRA